jgi:hypothetical protein
MFASTARVAQERNLMNNMRLEDEGRRELDSEFILPVTKRLAASVADLDLVPFLPWDPEWIKKSRYGSEKNIPDHISGIRDGNIRIRDSQHCQPWRKSMASLEDLHLAVQRILFINKTYGISLIPYNELAWICIEVTPKITSSFIIY